MSAPTKPKYRTTDWKAYNEALRARGSLMVWMDMDMRRHGGASGKRGRSPKYSEAAIQVCLTMKKIGDAAPPRASMATALTTRRAA
jgi:hypothetical protein